MSQSNLHHLKNSSQPLSATEIGHQLGISYEQVQELEAAGQLFSLVRLNRNRGREYPAFQVVTDRRNGATDVRRNGASNRWVKRRPEGVKTGAILRPFAGRI